MSTELVLVAVIVILIVIIVQGAWHRRSSRRKSTEVTLVDLDPDPDEAERLWTLDDLTSREMEIARLVAIGKRDKEIAAALHISTHTVDTHLRHIRHKLGVSSRTEIAHRFHDLL